LMDYLRVIGKLDNTIVVLLSDNGASQEGGPHGVVNTTIYENMRFPSLEDNLPYTDAIDGRTTHVNYPLGWAQAGNTPLKRYKQNTHAGGIRTSMIVRLPHARHAGQKRGHFQHVTDIVPTVLDYIGLEAPRTRCGLSQLPLDGRSMRDTIERPEAVSRERVQYFETVGHRAIWKDGWKAVAYHQRHAPFEEDQWELYHVDQDFSERHDLSATHPEKVRELVDAWWVEARRNLVLPLDDRGFAERANMHFKPHSPRDRSRFVYFNGMAHIGTAAAPPIPGRSFRIDTEVERGSEQDQGVLLSHGSVNSGYCLLVQDSRLVYDFNYYGTHHVLRSTVPVPLGRSRLAMQFLIDPGATSGTVTLSIDDRPAGEMRLAETFEFFVAFEGLDVGRDGLSPVRENPVGAFPFSGQCEQVVVEILDDSRQRPHEPLD
jgi:hypothetical protein